MKATSLAEEIGCEGETTPLLILTLNGISEQVAKKVTANIQSSDTSQSFELNPGYAVEHLPLGNPTPVSKNLENQFPELKGYHLPLQSESPSILIGLDHADLIACREVRPLSSNGPYLQKTLHGWSVTGRAILGDDTRKAQLVHRLQPIGVTNDATELSDLVKSSWTTEAFGCKYNDDVSKSFEDRKSEEILSREVLHNGTRWVAPILRRNETESFPPSLQMARKRACLFEHRLDKSEAEGTEFAELCYQRMEKMLADGHFRKISDHEAGVKPPNTWYLPILAVTNPNKPGKVRLVLDAAAKSHGKSLNDFLMKGPDLFNPIPDILIRFRERRIGLTSDVTAMFSQVLVKNEDRPSLRFLWRGRRRSGRFDEYESPVVIFGARSSPAVAEYCFQRTAEEFAPSEKDVLNAIKKDTYVDDVITGAASVEDATHLVAKVTEALDKGGFKLGRWSTNSEVVWQSLSPELRSEEPVNIDIKEHTERALGVFWSPTTDELTFRPKVKDVPATKRTVLSIVMTVYDPLGLLACWLIRARILLQDLWKLSLDWDESIPDELMPRWNNWLADLAEINTVRVKRHNFEQDVVEEVELHTFTDASNVAYGAAVYYRWIDSSTKKPCVRLMMTRTRVAPLKVLSVPRLKLQAAVLGARLAHAVKKSSSKTVKSSTFWTDSINVLSWITAEDRRYDTFVSNRIAEIQDLTERRDWRYVPSRLNIADVASRGLSLAELQACTRWENGPHFLHTSADMWPEHLEIVNAAQPVQSHQTRETVLDAGRFSRWTVAVRTMATVLRWIPHVRDHLRGEFSAEEIEQAEKMWMKEVQKASYPQELSDLEAGKEVHKSSRIYSLSPILKDGLICVDTRLSRYPHLSGVAKFPPFLPSDHPYVELLIERLHRKMGHRTLKAVRIELRMKCWVHTLGRLFIVSITSTECAEF